MDRLLHQTSTFQTKPLDYLISIFTSIKFQFKIKKAYMVAKTYSAIPQATSSTLIEVEVNISSSEEGNIIIVGLPDTAAKEARDRVKPALYNSSLCQQKQIGLITVNLAPADIRKEGSSFDLAIAIAILGAFGQIPLSILEEYLFAGELALDGTIRPIRASLSLAFCAKNSNKKGIFLPEENAAEGALVSGIEVFPVKHLSQLVAHLQSPENSPLPTININPEELLNSKLENTSDFAEVKGQESAKRALEIAAAGGHNIILVGPPGTGKSMLAKRLPSILPPLTLTEALEVTQIHSMMGLLKPGHPLITQRPFRAPHHSASPVGLIGGGSNPVPGEITLAHHGVLFLDELPEFSRIALETMRQPLEEGWISISRASASVTFPAQFMLIAAMNPTPDGNMIHESKSSRQQIQRYLGKISGPLLDRIDLHIEVPKVSFKEMTSLKPTGESSAQIRERVILARQKQSLRFEKLGITCNARMQSREMRKFCNLNQECLTLLNMAMQDMHLSARAYDKIRKVARTIADLDNSDEIQPPHLLEACQYRNLDRQVWSYSY